VIGLRIDYWYLQEDWCKEQNFKGKHYYHWSDAKWYFEHEEEATLFALRWS